MCRNRLEILVLLFVSISLAKYFITVLHSWLSIWLIKCNYREYIYGVKDSLINSYKALVCGKVKGTISEFTSKGTSECEKVLDTNVFNLVNFMMIVKEPLKPLVLVAGGSFVTTLQLG
jgi:hypothetical protein